MVRLNLSLIPFVLTSVRGSHHDSKHLRDQFAAALLDSFRKFFAFVCRTGTAVVLADSTRPPSVDDAPDVVEP